eukprot:804578-Amphidinium_carterae.1
MGIYALLISFFKLVMPQAQLPELEIRWHTNQHCHREVERRWLLRAHGDQNGSGSALSQSLVHASAKSGGRLSSLGKGTSPLINNYQL